MPGTAVFVDETGQRHRRAGFWLKVAGLVPLLYVLFFLASLVRAPWVPKVSLPGLGPVVPPAAVQPPPLASDQVISTPLPAATATLNGGAGTSSVPALVATTAPTSVPSTLAPTSTTPPSTTPPSATPSTRSGGGGPPSTPPGSTNPRRP